MDIIENKLINEKIYIHHYPNGLDLLLIPKKDYLKKMVMFGTKFGSINNKFVINGERVEVPDGIAHFLEHKVFEQEDGEDALLEMTSMGANPNAYTTTDHTVYYFDTIENFDKCTDLLFKFVQSPYFTDENVKKEQGIIGQEIQMYDDNEYFQVDIQLLQGMYEFHPVRIDTAGTIETISHITKELLYKCYNTFYDISNMVVCVCGDIDIDEMVNKIGNLIPKQGKKENIKELFPVEPEGIYKKESIKVMPINTPLFAVGFKDNGVGKRDNGQRILFDVSAEIVMEILFGKTSKMFKETYEQGYLTDELYKSYSFERDYGYAMLEANSTNPKKVIEAIRQAMNTAEISKEDFERTRRMLEGTFLFEFNDIRNITRMVFADYIRGVNSLEYIDAYKKVTYEDVLKTKNELFKEENLAISIIDKKGE